MLQKETLKGDDRGFGEKCFSISSFMTFTLVSLNTVVNIINNINNNNNDDNNNNNNNNNNNMNENMNGRRFKREIKHSKNGIGKYKFVVERQYIYIERHM